MSNFAAINHSDGRDELENEIKRLEMVDTGVTKPRLPSVSLEEKQYAPPTDAELASRAENELDEYKRTGLAGIRDKNAADEKAITAARDGYGKSLDAELSALESSYQNAVRASDNDAIKRGLARSSVATVNRAEIEKAYLAQNAEISATYGKKISELDAEISALGSKLQTALNDFNLSYASRLNTRIAELKSERDKKISDVTEYNNTVRAKQAELDEKLARAESDLYSASIAQNKSATSLGGLTEQQRDKMYRAVYDAMDKYLGSMDAIEAKKELRTHTLYREHLSAYYYARLYDKYGRDDPPGASKKDDR